MENTELIELCEAIGRAVELPHGLHVSAVFEDNNHDEIIGWRVLDGDNKPFSAIFSVDELKDLKRFKFPKFTK